ncbi:MAG: hypothetical protein AAB573_04790 [Patescibacteria group bacterium]
MGVESEFGRKIESRLDAAKAGYVVGSDVLVEMNTAYGGQLSSAQSVPAIEALGSVAMSPLVKELPSGRFTYRYYHRSLIPTIARAYFAARKDVPESTKALAPERVQRTLQKLDAKFGV